MRYLAFLLITCLTLPALAHQPIMDMAPRWEGGYGVQTRVEHANSRTTTWLEGVYTFKPSVRMTLKLPFEGGELGDAIFAVPLKRYKNEGAFTSNWGLTPFVVMPTGESEDWEPGLSLSYSSETPSRYLLADLYGREGQTGIDFNYGLVFPTGNRSSWFTLWDISALDSDSGERILTGPVLVYYRNNIVMRGELKLPAYDRDSAWDGNYVSLGIGVVY